MCELATGIHLLSYETKDGYRAHEQDSIVKLMTDEPMYIFRFSILHNVQITYSFA